MHHSLFLYVFTLILTWCSAVENWMRFGANVLALAFWSWKGLAALFSSPHMGYQIAEQKVVHFLQQKFWHIFCWRDCSFGRDCKCIVRSQDAGFYSLSFCRYPGGASWTPAWEIHQRDPTSVLRRQVSRRMSLDHNRRNVMERLHIYPTLVRLHIYHAASTL